jgi:hypothetical protein
MRRFLLGEAGARIGPHIGMAVSFDAYNVDKMIALLQQSIELSFRRDSAGRHVRWGGTPCSEMSLDLITKEVIVIATGEPVPVINPNTGALLDPVVAKKFIEFLNTSRANEYFLPSTVPAHPDDFRVTREFWLYMLRKYNYIVP